MSALLEIDSINAGYGDANVLGGVSLKVEKGSITALIGANGVGKTTLMRVISGLLRPQSGRIVFADRDITAASTSVRVSAGMALVPEGRLVFPDMSVQETLKLGAYVLRARLGWRKRLDAIFEMFPRLHERRKQRAGSLSGGEQQMLALGRGLMSDPQLLLLDEPSLGLAPIMADFLFESIVRIRASGVTVCLVEQDARAALSIADHAYIIEHGVVVGEGGGPALLDDPTVRGNILGL